MDWSAQSASPCSPREVPLGEGWPRRGCGDEQCGGRGRGVVVSGEGEGDEECANGRRGDAYVGRWDETIASARGTRAHRMSWGEVLLRWAVSSPGLVMPEEAHVMSMRSLAEMTSTAD